MSTTDITDSTSGMDTATTGTINDRNTDTTDTNGRNTDSTTNPTNFPGNRMDMLHGPLAGKLLLFTLPIALRSMLQQLFHAADLSIIGRFDSPASLAAVGTNGEIVALIVSLSSGLALGVNVFVAQQIGKHREESLPGILRSSLMLAILIGLAGLILGQFFSRSVLDLLRTPQNILEIATRYLRIYFLGYPFILLYDFGAAILRAKGDSRSPFLLLILAGAVNIALNLLFVAVFHLGVAGVATATCLSNIVSAAGTLWYLAKPFSLSVPHRAAGQPEPHLRPNASLHLTLSHWLSILKTGIPSAIQGAVFCFANLFVQAGVNRFGATAIAGSTIAMNFEYFTYYVITAFAQTATTFVSQNWAAGQKERCRRIFRLCLGFCLATSLLILESLTLFRAHVSGLFSPDPDVIRYACARILYILPLEPLCTLYEIPAGFLRGTGHAVYPAAATILGTCALRILWICTIFRTHPKLEILYVAFPLSWILTTVLVLAGFLYYKNSQLHDI